MKPIIFLHIPKTAGTSFRAAAESWFGKRNLLFDYGAQARKTSHIFRDLEKGKAEWSEVVKHVEKCRFITGHFPASRYINDFNSTCFCTFVRDPVRRMISQYFHHKHKLGYEKGIESFVEESRFHDHQHRLLAGISIEEMGFVGVTERYGESIALFNQCYGTKFAVAVRNQRVTNTQEKEVSESVIQRIRVNNPRDLRLYEKAVQQLEARLALSNLNSSEVPLTS